MIAVSFRRLAWLALAPILLQPALAFATCFPIAGIGEPRYQTVALPPSGSVRLTYLGHSSFLIESPGGATAVTDYNGSIRAELTPRVVTMNNAHSTHYTDHVEPGVEHVLRGWGEGGQLLRHNVLVEDMRVRNVPTNVRDFGGTRYNGNSIFVFEVADLCVAHLGHLHHLLEDQHLGELGEIDVLLVPIDGSYTMSHEQMSAAVRQINAPVIVPMHYFGSATLERFAKHIADRYEVVVSDSPSLTLSRATLPYRKLIVLPSS